MKSSETTCTNKKLMTQSATGDVGWKREVGSWSRESASTRGGRLRWLAGIEGCEWCGFATVGLRIGYSTWIVSCGADGRQISIGISNLGERSDSGGQLSMWKRRCDIRLEVQSIGVWISCTARSTLGGNRATVQSWQLERLLWLDLIDDGWCGSNQEEIRKERKRGEQQ